MRSIGHLKDHNRRDSIINTHDHEIHGVCGGHHGGWSPKAILSIGHEELFLGSTFPLLSSYDIIGIGMKKKIKLILY